MKKMNKGMALMAVMLAMMLALTGCGVSITDITVPDVVQVGVGETATVDITYVDAKNTDQAALAEAAAKAGLSWEMADTAIATVDGTTITGVAAGETTLTIKMGDITKTVTVQVVVPVEGVEAPETLALAINGEDSKPLDAKLVPAGATGAKLAYKSSDETVATVDENGVVTAVAEGECVITTTVVAEATWTAETKVTVTTAPTAITLAKSEGVLYVGGTTTLQVYTVPETAAAPDPKDIVYVSADDKVATVDEAGKVTAKAVGQTTITVTYQGLTAEYKLVVKAKSAGGGNTGTKPATGGGSTTGTGGGSTGGTTPSTGGGGGGTAPAPAPAPAPDPAPPSGGGTPDKAPDGNDWHDSPDMNTDGAGDTGTEPEL